MKSELIWLSSFVLGMVAFRYLLTPLGTISRWYHLDGGTLTYLDVYIFGIRIARIHTNT
jgi:hypothetical protein